MKKSLTAALAAAALLLVGCGALRDEPVPTPSPTPEQTPMSTPMAEYTPDAGPQAGTEGDTAGLPGMMDGIADFVEGAAVEVAKLPAAITEAISGRYPEASIKGATYSTYQDRQTYRIVLEGAGEPGGEVYVTADGEILPAAGTEPAAGEGK